MTETEEPIRIRLEDLHLAETKAVEGSDDLEFDLGNLLVFGRKPWSSDHAELGLEKEIKTRALTPTKILLTELSRLPRLHSTSVLSLPSPTIPVPREKPFPTTKPLTKWEAFAKKKGVKKRKKERKVWDESTGEWRRPYGYKRANDPKDVVIMDAKSTDKPGESPFEALEVKKKERVKKQEERELRNLQKAVQQGVKLPESVKLTAKLPKHGKGHPMERKEIKEDLSRASKMAGISTASMGKFDQTLVGEHPDERVSKAKKRTLVTKMEEKEDVFMDKLAQKMIKERSENVLNVEKAMGRLEADKRRQRHQDKLIEGVSGTKKQQRSHKKRNKNRQNEMPPIPKIKINSRQKKIKRRHKK